jgi:hypothetical protein
MLPTGCCSTSDEQTKTVARQAGPRRREKDNGSRPMPLIDNGVPEQVVAHIAERFHSHPQVTVVFGPANAIDTNSN